MDLRRKRESAGQGRRQGLLSVPAQVTTAAAFLSCFYPGIAALPGVQGTVPSPTPSRYPASRNPTPSTAPTQDSPVALPVADVEGLAAALVLGDEVDR
jgi:hypothetical protein